MKKEGDKEFFSRLAEQELLRLACLEGDDHIACGCEVLEHRKIVQQFRLKNLAP